MASGTLTRLQETYKKDVVPGLQDAFGYKNPMQVPHLEKMVINMGVKEGAQDIKVLEQLQEELAMIAGQRPVVTKAKKSIAGFKIRQGVPIGLKVTLRGKRMYEFFDRLVNIAMPRIRDFQGYSDKSFDGRGNYTIGLTEQTIFPEVEFDKIRKIQGMDVTFVTTAKTDDEAKKLLELLGFPFKKK